MRCRVGEVKESSLLLDVAFDSGLVWFTQDLAGTMTVANLRNEVDILAQNGCHVRPHLRKCFLLNRALVEMSGRMRDDSRKRTRRRTRWTRFRTKAASQYRRELRHVAQRILWNHPSLFAKVWFGQIVTHLLSRWVVFEECAIENEECGKIDTSVWVAFEKRTQLDVGFTFDLYTYNRSHVPVEY